MQTDRLFEMVYILMEKEKTTASELARRMEVSPRTIYRALDALGAAGIPVCTTKGKGGGIGLMPGFSLDRSLVSAQDQEDILFALQSMRSLNVIESDRILSKLGGIFRKSAKDWLSVDFTPWGGSQKSRQEFEAIKTAILRQRQLQFFYYSATGSPQLRTVEPLMLHFKNSAWYLQAYCLLREDYRVFKLSRMQDIILLDTAFDAHQNKVPPLESIWSNPGKLVRLTLRISGQASYRLMDHFGHLEKQPHQDGYLVSLYRIADDGLYEYLLSFGHQIEVVAPPEVRDEFVHRLRLISQQYGNILP